MNKIIITNIYKKEIFSHKQEDNTIKITIEKANLCGVDLHEVDLHEVDLWGIDLHGTNLWGADLWGANLRRANLCETDLHGVDLWGADLWGANLYGANLHRANLCGANLHRANLHRANLCGVDLWGVDLWGANLYGAKIDNFFRTNLNILKCQKNNLIVYKYLNKNLSSPYQNFKYEIGKEYISIEANENEKILCGKGINVATLEWCLQNTNNNTNDYLYIECEVNPNDLIIPFNSDGKFRIKTNGKVRFNKILTEKEINEKINN